MRAEIAPRLRQDIDRWLVLEPFRPLDRPFAALASMIAKAFARYGEARHWKRLRDELQGSAEASALVELNRELRLVARQPDTSVLLILDQVEDLLGYAPNGEASCFLPLLRAAIAGPGSPFFVLGTLYSDFLGDFQKHAALREMPFEQIAMSTMSVNFRGSITRPVTSLPLAPRLHCWLST